MMDEHSIKQAALDEVKKMLREQIMKRLGGLGETPGDEPVEKPEHPEDGDAALLGKDDAEPDAEDANEPAEGDEGDEGDEPADEPKADGGKPGLHALVMKRLNQVIKTKGK